jgi:hypothetical protein
MGLSRNQVYWVMGERASTLTVSTLSRLFSKMLKFSNFLCFCFCFFLGGFKEFFFVKEDNGILGKKKFNENFKIN